MALNRHIELLQKWNQRINLTAITDPDKLVDAHLLDSLSIASYLKGSRILDIGSGAGFPGLPLALLFTNKQFTLLDSRTKRIGFLHEVCQDLTLKNITLVRQRVEKYQPQQKFDTLVARAFSSLVDLYLLTRHLHHYGLRILAMKGKYPQGEIDRFTKLHSIKPRVLSVEVPGLGQSRHLIEIDIERNICEH